MNKLERFLLEYGLSVIAYVIYGSIAVAFLIKFSAGWFNMLLVLATMAVASTFAYINGWYRGQWDEKEERERILREVNANSISGKTKQKTR